MKKKVFNKQMQMINKSTIFDDKAHVPTEY